MAIKTAAAEGGNKRPRAARVDREEEEDGDAAEELGDEEAEEEERPKVRNRDAIISFPANLQLL